MSEKTTAENRIEFLVKKFNVGDGDAIINFLTPDGKDKKRSFGNKMGARPPRDLMGEGLILPIIPNDVTDMEIPTGKWVQTEKLLEAIEDAEKKNPIGITKRLLAVCKRNDSLKAMHGKQPAMVNEEGFGADFGKQELSQVGEYVISEEAFFSIVDADPTDKKFYVQWMLTMFMRYLRKGKFEDARRYVCEDLGMANDYLEIFHEYKHKKLFAQICKNIQDEADEEIQQIEDFSDINQYRSLSRLFLSVKSFIESDSMSLLRNMNLQVKAGNAKILFKDDKFTVYVPLAIEGSEIFSSFASWCTARHANSHFTGYTNQTDAMGNKSHLYIIIDNNLFLHSDEAKNNDGYGRKGKKTELWQFHFESSQIMTSANSSEPDVAGNLLLKSRGLRKFFYDILIQNARASTKSGTMSKSNKYVSHLIKFGYSNILFDIMDENETVISFQNETIDELPDISKFTKLTQLILQNVSLVKMHKSLGKLKNLEVLSMPNNNISEIPSYFGGLKKLVFLNLAGNKLKKIDDNIGELDLSRGGTLNRITINLDTDEKLVAKLNKLLPNVEVNLFKREEFN